MLRWIGIALVVLVVLVAGAVLKTLSDAGQFTELKPHFSGECRRVTGAVGTEDLTIHPQTGVVYVSASDRRALARGAPEPGGIYSYDLGAANPRLVNRTPDRGIAFQPHGISLWVGPDGRGVLFAINHPPQGSGLPAHTVEVFDLRGEALVHRASLSDPEWLVMPNDLVAVGPDRFYLTNTHRNPPGRAQLLETYLRLAGARVVFWDGSRFRPAIEDLIFPNGINRSPDGRTLYVATTTPRSLLVYDRDPASELLTPREQVFVGSGLDNVEVDAEGDLWIGAHPKLLAVGAHRDDPQALSPSQVIHLRRGANGVWSIEEVYLDAGEQISAASVGAVRGRRLVIGQIFGDGILDCTRE